MKTAEEFDGFPREGVKFLRDLSRNNNREWFNKHKTGYEKSLLTPAKNFVTAMGDRLKEISPNIVANPAVNQSLFRLNRDTRFSADKTPYKTHLSIFFWEGAGKRMENPGFYLCFDAKTLTLAGGAHEFPKEKLVTEIGMRKAETVLQAGVQAADDGKQAEAKPLLEDALERFKAAEAVELGVPLDPDIAVGLGRIRRQGGVAGNVEGFVAP